MIHEWNKKLVKIKKSQITVHWLIGEGGLGWVEKKIVKS